MVLSRKMGCAALGASHFCKHLHVGLKILTFSPGCPGLNKHRHVQGIIDDSIFDLNIRSTKNDCSCDLRGKVPHSGIKRGVVGVVFPGLHFEDCDFSILRNNEVQFILAFPVVVMQGFAMFAEFCGHKILGQSPLVYLHIPTHNPELEPVHPHFGQKSVVEKEKFEKLREADL